MMLSTKVYKALYTDVQHWTVVHGSHCTMSEYIPAAVQGTAGTTSTTFSFLALRATAEEPQHTKYMY